MLYEIRTYNLKPRSVPEVEARFAEAIPHREKYSKLWAFWHTEVGPLNQIIHVWPYESLDERARIRAEAAKDPHWPPKIAEYIVSMEAEIYLPTPFMHDWGDGAELGSIYEMRIYTYRVGTMPQVLEQWQLSLPNRERHSPLAACWYSELGGLNKFIHVWPYKSLEDRARIRAEASKDATWPPKTGEWMVSQENKLLVPASFSRMR